MGRTRVRIGAATDVGRTRSHNEDNYGLRVPDDPEIADRKGVLLVVCDGMGGHAAGEVASQIAVETILATYFELPAEDPGAALVEAIELANKRIYEQASQRPDQRGMGTTCVAVVLRGDQFTIAHAGDSRAYLVRQGTLSRLTRDHSLVEEWVSRGVLPADQADQHPMSNVITRALGHAPDVVVEVGHQPANPSDIVMLCSDGLSGRITEEAIRSTIETNDDPERTVASLIEQANASGGPDNISVIVAVVEEVEPVAETQDTTKPETTLPTTKPVGQPEGATGPAPKTQRVETTRRTRSTATQPAVRAVPLAPIAPAEAVSKTADVAATGSRASRGCYVVAAAVLLALMVVALAVAAALMGWIPGVKLAGLIAMLV